MASPTAASAVWAQKSQTGARRGEKQVNCSAAPPMAPSRQ